MECPQSHCRLAGGAAGCRLPRVTKDLTRSELLVTRPRFCASGHGDDESRVVMQDGEAVGAERGGRRRPCVGLATVTFGNVRLCVTPLTSAAVDVRPGRVVSQDVCGIYFPVGLL